MDGSKIPCQRAHMRDTSDRLDFSGLPFFDNHTHTLSADPAPTDPVALAMNFLHGYRDLPDAAYAPDAAGTAGADTRPNGISEELALHVRNMGAVHTMTARLSRLYGCDETLDAVTACRNRRVASGPAEYAKSLYDDARIAGTMVDSELPMGDPAFAMFPCSVLRLFQMDPLFSRLLGASDSFSALKRDFQERVDQAIRIEGYAAIKCHIGELYTMDARLVEDREAEAAFAAAKSGDAESVRTVYYCVFASTLVQCRELGVPIHIHSGHTGGGIDAHISKTNPILLEPLLKLPRFLNTTVVFLHGAYPHVQTAALMAHHLPHVWIDLSWTLPWTSLRFDRAIEDVLAIAPHSKIMLGSGQHGIPEISWLAAHVAKDSLSAVLSEAVSRGNIGRAQAEASARMICVDNARRLYGAARFRVDEHAGQRGLAGARAGATGGQNGVG